MQRPQSSPPVEMSACVFSERFNHLPSSVTTTLSHEYTISSGRAPTRQRLRELSHQLAVSQARIKKWFMDKADEEERAKRKERLLVMEESRRERLLAELRDCLRDTEEILSKLTICDESTH